MINENSPIAMYSQLKDILVGRIKSGDWKPTEQLPTEVELCEAYNVSRITVRKALEEMTREGYIYRKSGKGTFVKVPSITQRLSNFYSFSEEMSRIGIHESVKLVRFDLKEVDQSIMQKLELPSQGKCFIIHRVRYANDETYANEVSYIPHHIFPELTSDHILQKGLYNTLREFNFAPDRATERFRAVSAGRYIAKLLEIEENLACIELTRTTFSLGRTIEYCESMIRGDKFEYTVELK